MTAPSDADIIRASLSDPQAFGDLFSRHVDAVHAYLSRRTGRAAADDLTGDVFRIAFERRRSFDLARCSALPWLYGIAANVVHRHQRDRWRRLRAYHRFQTRQPTEAEDTTDASAASLDAVHQRGRLHAAVQALARRDREVLLLHVWEEVSYAQIAESLDIPLGTVRSRLHRARRQLRARLEECEPALEERQPVAEAPQNHELSP